MSDKVDWLFGTGPWTWRIGLGALNPVSAARWYRALRRRRGTYRWKRRGVLRYMLGCRWDELTGWTRATPERPQGSEWWKANP